MHGQQTQQQRASTVHARAQVEEEWFWDNTITIRIPLTNLSFTLTYCETTKGSIQLTMLLGIAYFYYLAYQQIFYSPQPASPK